MSKAYSTFLSSIEVANLMGVTHSTLQEMRWQNRGPSYHRVGSDGGTGWKVIYDVADVEAWLKANGPGPQSNVSETLPQR